MKRRNLGLGLAVLASSSLLLVGNASAAPPATATCIVHSLPSFVAQGEGVNEATVADVIEVECNPAVYGTGEAIKVTAKQLYLRCKQKLTWFVPNPYARSEGEGVTVDVDADGNATVAALSGPGCAMGESLITAHLEEPPFESFTTAFQVMSPKTTPPGVTALPATQVEDSRSSAVATIIQAEFSDASEQEIQISSEELFKRCRIAPHLHLIRMSGSEETDVAQVTKVPLDNDGNAFVIAVGDASCAEGASLIEADLESNPFTTFHTDFTILPPQTTEF
jgi:hypothetical protein